MKIENIQSLDQLKLVSNKELVQAEKKDFITIQDGMWVIERNKIRQEIERREVNRKEFIWRIAGIIIAICAIIAPIACAMLF